MFKPDLYLERVTFIPLQKLLDNGIKLLAYDLDNTLDYPDKMTSKIIEDIENHLDEAIGFGFEVLIISNNTIKGRVESFAKIKGFPYIEGARKPFQKKYRSSEIISKYKKEEICFIGDKIVTDVIGAKRYGSLSILVDPIQVGTKHWYTKVMKTSEAAFRSATGFKKGKYYDKM